MVGGRLEGVAGDAVRIEGGARMAVKPNYIRLDTAGVARRAWSATRPATPATRSW